MRNLEEKWHSFVERQESINNQTAQTLADLKDTLAKFTSALSIHEREKFLSELLPNPKNQSTPDIGSSNNQYMDQAK